MLRRSRVHFVHCMLPKAEALKALSGSMFKGGECEIQGEPGEMQVDVALLRAQLRGSKLLDALRIYRQGESAAHLMQVRFQKHPFQPSEHNTGYPDHMVFSEFRRRFDVLAPHLTKKHGRNYIVKDEKRVSQSARQGRNVLLCLCLQPRLMLRGGSFITSGPDLSAATWQEINPHFSKPLKASNLLNLISIMSVKKPKYYCGFVSVENSNSRSFVSY